MRLFPALAIAILACSGCAHNQLRWNTVKQSATLTDIYEQQVLNNLAMFVYDQGSLPFFSVPNSAATDVSGEGSVGAGFDWSDTSFLGSVLNLGGSRGMRQAWTLVPVSDPRRLERMRCAYQQVVWPISNGAESSCPNCSKVLDRFYLGSDTEKDLVTHTAESGRITTACLSSSLWFGYGPKECVPKDSCGCLKVGHYCGTYVWLLPGGQDQLSKLSIVMLDFATNAPPATPTREVEWYLDNNSLPATEANATHVVRATLPASTDTGVKIKTENGRTFGVLPQPVAGAKTSSTGASGEVLPPPTSSLGNPSMLEFRQDLQFLAPSP